MFRIQRLFELILRDESFTLPEGSEVRIDTSLERGEGDSAYFRFEILDNGLGLPRESLRAVFDPFFVRNQDPQGFGLNLMTAYFIVYHHGGTIQIEDIEPRGTRFVIRIPVSPQAPWSQNEESEFLARVLMNDNLWDRILRAA